MPGDQGETLIYAVAGTGLALRRRPINAVRRVSERELVPSRGTQDTEWKM